MLLNFIFDAIYIRDISVYHNKFINIQFLRIDQFQFRLEIPKTIVVFFVSSHVLVSAHISESNTCVRGFERFLPETRVHQERIG